MPRPPDDLDPVAMLEDHLAVGWEHQVEVVLDAPVDEVRRALPRSLGTAEVLDDGRARLVGSTSNPACYAQQLAGVPVPYRIVGSAEIREAARALGERLLAASGSDDPAPVSREGAARRSPPRSAGGSRG